MPRAHIYKLMILLVLTVSSAVPALYAAEVVNRISAVVNDEVITESELKESMLPFVADYRLRYGEEKLKDKVDEARADALNRLIEEKLILQQAYASEMVIDRAEIDERIALVRSRAKTEEEFHALLEKSGLTVFKLRKKYEEQIMMKRLISGLVNARVNITPTQIGAYYYGRPDEFQTPNIIRFKVLMLRPLPDRDMEQTREFAKQLIDRAKAGEEFDMLVKQYSQGPNLDKGGDMGYMPESAIVEHIRGELADLQGSEMSDVIETESGITIVQVVDKKESGTMSFVEARDIIYNRLFQREAELTLREFVNKLKEDAYIKINETEDSS
ncbi:MAG: peptidylprolyl isomerase [Candidatus Omnitrophica bacterium]|nr:peptidylprolyl isomerase [Candidatus Omnitrophota bacterium]